MFLYLAIALNGRIIAKGLAFYRLPAICTRLKRVHFSLRKVTTLNAPMHSENKFVYIGVLVKKLLAVSASVTSLLYRALKVKS